MVMNYHCMRKITRQLFQAVADELFGSFCRVKSGAQDMPMSYCFMQDIPDLECRTNPTFECSFARNY